MVLDSEQLKHIGKNPQGGDKRCRRNLKDGLRKKHASDWKATKNTENYSWADTSLFFPRIDMWLNKEMDKTIIYIVCNYAGLISKICADLLFGEQVRFIVGEEGSTEQEAINNIVDSNKLHIKNYEMALSASWRGRYRA